MLSFYPLLLMTVTMAVVLIRRSIYSILCLILLFVLVAFLVISWKVDFIGLIFIIVYVGAIATLFLFIIMMLGGEEWKVGSQNVDQYNLLQTGKERNKWLNGFSRASWYVKFVVVDLLLMLCFGLVLTQLFDTALNTPFRSWLDVTQATYATTLVNGAYQYGIFFYNYWFIPFLIAGVVLLVAMLGSIILTTRLLTVDSDPKQEPKKIEVPLAVPVGKLTFIEELQAKQKALNKEAESWLAWAVQSFWLIACMYFFLHYTPDIFTMCLEAKYAWKAVCIIFWIVGSYMITQFWKRFM